MISGRTDGKRAPRLKSLIRLPLWPFYSFTRSRRRHPPPSNRFLSRLSRDRLRLAGAALFFFLFLKHPRDRNAGELADDAGKHAVVEIGNFLALRNRVGSKRRMSYRFLPCTAPKGNHVRATAYKVP